MPSLRCVALSQRCQPSPWVPKSQAWDLARPVGTRCFSTSQGPSEGKKDPKDKKDVTKMKVAVIGPPGHGKSTFLNVLAQDDLFKTGSTADSCTQEVQRKVIILKQKDQEGQEHQLHLTVVDTPGFPDTDPEKAQKYYDKVVSACNQPLNAIILVVKPERATHDLLYKYRVLLREFNNAGPPIFMVANGTENYSGIINEQNKKEKKETDRCNFGKFANRVVEESHVAVARIFVSTEIADIQSEVKEQLFMALGGTDPTGSNMKTSQQLLDEVEEAKRKDESAELEVQKMNEEEDKQRRNIEQLESTLEWWEECRRLGWVPLIGLILEAAAMARIKLVKEEIEYKKEARKELMWKNESIRRNIKRLMDNFQSALTEVTQLCKALSGR